MRVQPRQQILDIWRAVASLGVNGEKAGGWKWGGRDGRNSISDAEQLLCIMHPASLVNIFRLDQPDETDDEAADALRKIGDSIDIPRRLIRYLTEYLHEYVDTDGAPDFSGGSYFNADDPEKISDEQRKLHVVDAYSMSITLTLATIGFVRVLRASLTRQELIDEAKELERLASVRLSAAMVGLLRSFTVNVFEEGSLPWQTLIGTVNQRRAPEAQVVEDLQTRLKEVRAGLRDLSIGSGQQSELEKPNLLFECGWTWGTLRGAPEIETTEPVGVQREGLAQRRPLLYFTTIALAGIVDLTSERTRVLRLLNEEQQRLAAALQLRYDLVRSYWATIASSESERWPLEDIPWRTSDGEESEYFSLLVTSLVTHDLAQRKAPDSDLERVLSVLLELASRGRVTRRPLARDQALDLHDPGVPLRLAGSDTEGGPSLTWVVSDFSVMLLKRVITLAGLTRSPELRSDLGRLADQVWDHLATRRIARPEGSLWDQPAEVFGRGATYTQPSWYQTERVMECLVMMADLVLDKPPRSDLLLQTATHQISEAAQLLDRELFSGSLEAGPAMRGSMQRLRAHLRRAQEIVNDKPATASALVADVLRGLDELDAARQSAAE
ncbi:SCO2524 family protein [Cryptosporangium aurantiacum]|uniref:Uncharacterized protein n=1 Tax=Cryptosporangium aurantiacum TaxID=134849 RepID=A0A1M7RK04_9ACTN|nr:SCO2524 family protein [Cryptosporangium aurantiacum]SHN46398.1 hypothetical protein SAMN05443668_11585 [Cryptosporangium aurantiacum]